jgi:hypothetical protein
MVRHAARSTPTGADRVDCLCKRAGQRPAGRGLMVPRSCPPPLPRRRRATEPRAHSWASHAIVPLPAPTQPAPPEWHTHLVAGGAQRCVQHRPVFRVVDVLPRKHGVHLGAQLGTLSQVEQQLRQVGKEEDRRERQSGVGLSGGMGPTRPWGGRDVGAGGLTSPTPAPPAQRKQRRQGC